MSHYSPREFQSLAINTLEGFLPGRCPAPVTTKFGLELGTGALVPEINFTLPPIDINPDTWADVRTHYTEMITGVCERAVALESPGLLVEFETLPPMTVYPHWGAELTQLLAETLAKHHTENGLKCALRLTPNDTRDHIRPPRMRSGSYWDGMMELFRLAGPSGADMLAIESTGGKEVNDEGLMNADLRGVVFALGVLAPRDMRFLWDEIVSVCNETGVIPSGDTACGFANTAMVLAEQKMVPRVFAAIVRVAAVPRSLVAYEAGAVGPSKDCAYEGPYMKAIAGVPISMEGRSSACAHLTSVGNIAQAVADAWSNESVQNVRLLSAQAPVVSMEHLIYDCRLHNVARAHGQVNILRDWLVESDAALDPQAWVLRPDVVLRLSAEIIQETSPYLRTRRAVLATIAEIKRAMASGELAVPKNEIRWLDRLSRQADGLSEDEDTFIAEMRAETRTDTWLPEEYGL